MANEFQMGSPYGNMDFNSLLAALSMGMPRPPETVPNGMQDYFGMPGGAQGPETIPNPYTGMIGGRPGPETIPVIDPNTGPGPEQVPPPPPLPYIDPNTGPGPETQPPPNVGHPGGGGPGPVHPPIVPPVPPPNPPPGGGGGMPVPGWLNTGGSMKSMLDAGLLASHKALPGLLERDPQPGRLGSSPFYGDMPWGMSPFDLRELMRRQAFWANAGVGFGNAGFPPKPPPTPVPNPNPIPGVNPPPKPPPNEQGF